MSARFDCTACGGPLTLRAEGVSESLACPHCGAVLDARDPRHQVLARYRARLGTPPKIPIGARGAVRGDKLEVVGHLRRAVRYSGVIYQDSTCCGTRIRDRWMVSPTGTAPAEDETKPRKARC